MVGVTTQRTSAGLLVLDSGGEKAFMLRTDGTVFIDVVKPGTQFVAELR